MEGLSRDRGEIVLVLPSLMGMLVLLMPMVKDTDMDMGMVMEEDTEGKRVYHPALCL